jgi:hypothetical protein
MSTSSALSHLRPLASHEGGSPPISWDGGTVIGNLFASLDPFMRLYRIPRVTYGCFTAVVIRQTPLTTDSAQHRWESAEVVMMDEATTEPMSIYSDASQTPSLMRLSTALSPSGRRSREHRQFRPRPPSVHAVHAPILPQVVTGVT